MVGWERHRGTVENRVTTRNDNFVSDVGKGEDESTRMIGMAKGGVSVPQEREFWRAVIPHTHPATIPSGSSSTQSYRTFEPPHS